MTYEIVLWEPNSALNSEGAHRLSNGEQLFHEKRLLLLHSHSTRTLYSNAVFRCNQILLHCLYSSGLNMRKFGTLQYKRHIRLATYAHELELALKKVCRLEQVVVALVGAGHDADRRSEGHGGRAG